MTNYQVHHSFNSIAPIQTYSIEALISEATRIKEVYKHLLEGEKNKIQEILGADEDKGLYSTTTTIFHHDDIHEKRKRYMNAHNSLIILKHLESTGWDKLQLDTSKDMFEQILRFAAHSRENRPRGVEIGIRRERNNPGVIIEMKTPAKENLALEGAHKAVPAPAPTVQH